MQQRLPSLLNPPITFAHRGASAHALENTIEAFQLALDLGATGLETDVWVTSDGIPVLNHDGSVGRGLLKKRISKLARKELPEYVPTLDDLLEVVDLGTPLSLDVCDPSAYSPIAEFVRRNSPDRAEDVWLCDYDLDRLLSKRDELAGFHLVHSTRLAKLPCGPEQHACRLQSEDIDAMNMHRTDWNGGLVVLFHRFERLAFGWDLQSGYQIEIGVRMGLDALYSDHVDTMTDVIAGGHGMDGESSDG